MSIWAKAWKAKTVSTTTRKSRVGVSSGRVTVKNRRVALIPSTVAASISSSGTACRPANTMMKVRPRFCQMDEIETPNSAPPMPRLGSDSQSTGK